MPTNMTVIVESRHYLLQPGDATLYRFSFRKYPDGKVYDSLNLPLSYIMESGIGKNASDYIEVSVNMPSMECVFCLPLHMLPSINSDVEEFNIDYLYQHGAKMDTYTLKAILYALSVLVINPSAVDEAAKTMISWI